MTHLYTLPLLIAFCMFAYTSQAQEDCSCTNCPLAITDNGTFQGFLEVAVDGPDDLGACPIQEVCFTITHTWVGDLSVTLTSPGGLNYLVMADGDNDTGGCGNSSDNINICIQPGIGNAITNNTDYACNAGPNCLNGNWTMPCGGVTDPVSGAIQAPNCDLNDFNVPGQPSNGTWILTVNDICAQDVGFLQDWSITFACDIIACYSCPTDGGQLNQADITTCQGDDFLNSTITPQYPGNVTPPNPATTDYTFVISQGGIILDLIAGPDLTGLQIGVYDICGLSYEAGQLATWQAYIGGTLANLQTDLANVSLELCADLSDDCFNLTLLEPIPPTLADTTICMNDCYTAPDGTVCCDPGACEYKLPSFEGCDSTIIVNLTFFPSEEIFQTETLCSNECITIDGTEYCPPGMFQIVFTNQFNCDSTINLELIEVPIEALIEPADTLTCFQMTVTLDGGNSIADTYEWVNETGDILGTDPTVDLTEPGCYSLYATTNLNGTSCSDTTEMCVVQNLILPELPDPAGNLIVCDGDIETYSIDTDPEASDYEWTFPADATLLSGGNGNTELTLDWAGSLGGQICVTALNPCGSGPESCFDIQVLRVPDNPVLTGPATACSDEPPFTVSTEPDPNVEEYSWTVSSDASIESGEDSNEITVQWGEDESGEICLTTKNECGESETTCMTVEKACNFREVPSAFSPNGDGLNDFFTVVKGAGVTLTGFQVFSRWGQLLYDNENGDAGWDGTFKDEPMPSDVYVYVINLSLSTGENVVEEGEVTLLR
ncbi:MAG: gliding motility-associated C-terminal domain-containing protein [Saprospiraceae bacterium]|nr:gliding motility-associated C-terminal domain-containing protein [Saprospiraceae bacterium]